MPRRKETKAIVFLSEGFEETEAVVTIDILRRGGVSVLTVSLTKDKNVPGAHGVVVQADATFWHVADDSGYDMLIFPGGPGTSNYRAHEGLLLLLEKYAKAEKQLAAICAAPTLFGELGLLEGKKCVCYPGMEDELKGGVLQDEPVVTDGNITTAKGPGATAAFALRLLALLTTQQNAKKVAEGFITKI